MFFVTLLLAATAIGVSGNLLLALSDYIDLPHGCDQLSYGALALEEILSTRSDKPAQ